VCVFVVCLCVCVCERERERERERECVCACVRACVRVYKDVQIGMSIQSAQSTYYRHICIHTYICTTHIQIHKHIHTLTHTLKQTTHTHTAACDAAATFSRGERDMEEFRLAAPWFRVGDGAGGACCSSDRGGEVPAAPRASFEF